MKAFSFKRVGLWSFNAVFTLGLVLPAWAQGAEMSYGQSVYNDTSPPLSEMAVSAAPLTRGLNREIPLRAKPDMGRSPSSAAPDGGLQTPGWSLGPTPGTIISEPGLSEADNLATVGFAVVPPDTNGDIGLDNDGNRIYIQYINSIWGVFDDTGTLIAGPLAGNTFWSGFGGFCESNNNGDPIVLYDDQVGRWMFSQFSVNEGIQCVAVSTTSDPLGPYHRYAFNVTPGGANDYPKMGVWHDSTADADGGQSAYTFTMRDFGGAGGAFSVSAGVMERDQMLAGNAAKFIKFSNPCGAGDCIEGQLPPHQAGPPPPANTCPTYWTAVDAGFDDSPHNNDGYRNHTLCVDWSSLASSTYGEGSFVVASSNFDRFLGDVSPVLGGDPLDSLSFFTMYRAQYRWFGTNARVVLNTTVNAGDERAGIRWAETRSADGDSGWFLQQDGTFAPDDGLERWMGSIAQDQSGNIALGYSVAGADLFPGVSYTSRMGGDPPGTLPGGEVSCVDGGGAQVNSNNRWGDYSSMSVDPTDDCTFWYTQEYYQTTGSFDFNTRICNFRFPGCGEACVPTEDGTELTCNDGNDNDCDGDFDCFDSDCALDDACVCVPQPEICDDGIDNDCDGLTDCDDPDCDLDPICILPGVPANDLCLNAIELACDETISGSTDGATFDDAGFCSTSNTAPGVWYKVAFEGLISASMCNQANYDSKLSAYNGECGELGCITGIDDSPGCGLTSEISWVGDNSEQLVLVHGFGAATGDFDLTISCQELAPGDICEDAAGPLAVDTVTPGTTTDTSFDDVGFCGTSNTAPGTWYTVTGTGNTMTASTCNDGNPDTGSADYDTKISVFCADCEAQECIGGQDDNAGAGCAGFSTKFAWPTQAGATYNVLVHGFGAGTGDFDLAILDDGVPAEGANDCDGISEEFDFCPGTVIPESVPTSGVLRSNNSALTDASGVFETALPNPLGVVYTIEDTAGCSCEQIVDELGVGQGHLRKGCSYSVMDDWLLFLDEASCGNCTEAHGEPGCEQAECEATVCALDSFCCDVAWDGICVGEALDLCVPDICIALPSSEAPSAQFQGRAVEAPAQEPVSKDPNYTPKK